LNGKAMEGSVGGAESGSGDGVRVGHGGEEREERMTAGTRLSATEGAGPVRQWNTGKRKEGVHPCVGFGSSWAGPKRECGGEQAACGLVTVAQERRGGPLVARLRGGGGGRERLGRTRVRVGRAALTRVARSRARPGVLGHDAKFGFLISRK